MNLSLRLAWVSKQESANEWVGIWVSHYFVFFHTSKDKRVVSYFSLKSRVHPQDLYEELEKVYNRYCTVEYEKIKNVPLGIHFALKKIEYDIFLGKLLKINDLQLPSVP